MATKTSDIIIKIPKEVFADLKSIKKNYPTTHAMCDALEILPQNLSRLALTKRCRQSTLTHLILSINRVKKN